MPAIRVWPNAPGANAAIIKAAIRPMNLLIPMSLQKSPDVFGCHKCPAGDRPYSPVRLDPYIMWYRDMREYLSEVIIPDDYRHPVTIVHFRENPVNYCYRVPVIAIDRQ